MFLFFLRNGNDQARCPYYTPEAETLDYWSGGNTGFHELSARTTNDISLNVAQ